VPLTRRSLLAAQLAGPVVATLARSRRAAAQGTTIRIGVLNDQSGPYRDTGGVTSVICCKQAVEEFGTGHGFSVDVITADHQNKPDIGAGIARQWIDTQAVDLILDVPTSSVALAVNSVCREKNKAYINVGAATADLTGKACAPNNVHWTYDTYMLARSTGGTMVKAGGDTWFFITADYVFGQQLQRDTSTLVTQAGGKINGSVAYPFPGTTDFSSFLLQAQSSGAKVLGFCNAGADTVNSIKQAHEFGVNTKMKLAAMLMFITDVNALGLATAQGLNLTESFYWDLNDRTRAFTKRVVPKTPNNWPNMIHAGCYSATLHYLKGIAAMDAGQRTDGTAVVSRMKAMPTDDDAYGQAKIREDGRLLVPAYLFEVKSPTESKGPWDYYKRVETTSADDAAVPLDKTGCSLVHS